MSIRRRVLQWTIFAVTLIFLAFNGKESPKPYIFPDLLFFPEMPVNPDNIVTEEGVNLGRHLFYDPILSGDSTMSCASCHRQEFAFADTLRFNEGELGIPLKRNTPALFNLAWHTALFWDGRAPSIEAQVFLPVRRHNEMNLQWPKAVERLNNSDFYRPMFIAAFGNSDIDSTRVAMAIAQFERTLLSYNAKYDRAFRRELAFDSVEFKGFELMNDQTKGNCLHCHTTDGDALGTTGKFSNNGLDAVLNPDSFLDLGRGAVTHQKSDFGKFKIPSLRNIALSPPYMHDGRFKTLEEVLDFYSDGVSQSVNIDSKMKFNHAGGVNLTAEEKACIIQFLHTLTDSTFITNPAFSNPFKD